MRYKFEAMEANNRTILKSMQTMLKKYPIIGLTGPRQSGKTTFLKAAFPKYRYVNLEEPDLREYAELDTRSFLQEYNDKVIFDEVQHVSKLFSYLQALVDKNKVMGQFILSGSQNFNLMNKITQSLAGRVALFKLFPYDFSEMKARGLLKNNLPYIFTQGSYPAIYDRKISPDKYYSDYINTYVLRDVTQLLNVHNMATFKKFIKLCATRVGQLVNFSDLAKDVGVSHSTIRAWISILETSYIVYFLQPFYKNYSKRMIKSPKLYFYDTGLLCHLLNIRNGKISPTHAHWGSIFENQIIGELIKQNEHRSIDREYYFWRDSIGHEIDLLWFNGEKICSAEIKSSNTIHDRFFSELSYFKQISEDKLGKQYLIYSGESAHARNNCSIISWQQCDSL